MVLSGEKPCDKASSDGKFVKLLGYKWDPELDILQPRFAELNLNLKTRGAKKPNKKPLSILHDTLELIKSTKLVD